MLSNNYIIIFLLLYTEKEKKQFPATFVSEMAYIDMWWLYPSPSSRAHASIGKMWLLNFMFLMMCVRNLLEKHPLLFKLTQGHVLSISTL